MTPMSYEVLIGDTEFISRAATYPRESKVFPIDTQVVRRNDEVDTVADISFTPEAEHWPEHSVITISLCSPKRGHLGKVSNCTIRLVRKRTVSGSTR